MDDRLEELFGLSGKGVLITGASSLISVWTARLLMQVGARVVMTDRVDEPAIEKAFADLAAEREDPALDLTGKVELIGSVDVRNRTAKEAAGVGAGNLVSVSEMVQKTKAHLGQIDILINIAGGQEPVPAALLSTKLFRGVVDRILIGTWNVIHEVFLTSMRDKGGRILTVTADTIQGFPGMPGMGAARNGLSSLHQALAVEWAPLGITCCVIAPGAVDTPGLMRYPQAERTRAIAASSSNMGRLIEPREVAWLFLTMASPFAAPVNGHTLVANGGDSFITPAFRELFR